MAFIGAFLGYFSLIPVMLANTIVFCTCLCGEVEWSVYVYRPYTMGPFYKTCVDVKKVGTPKQESLRH